MRIFERVVLIASLIACFKADAYAAFYKPQSKDIPDRVVASILPAAYPTTPLSGGKYDVKIVPGYFTYSAPHGPVDAKGFAVAAGVSYAFTNHVGVGVQFMGFNGSGRAGAACGPYSSNPPDGNCDGSLIIKGNHTVKSIAGAAGLILDPFSDPEGFRLPFWIGLSYFSLEQEITITHPAFTYDHKVRMSGPGVSFGLSPQFNVKKIRVSPFAMVSIPRSPDSTNTLTGTGAIASETHKGSSVDDTGSAGVEFAYRPWDLSFLYIIPVGVGGDHGVKTSFYSLAWKKSFGDGSGR